jgi:hypothetical protein
MSESRVRENRTHGLTGGRWRSGTGETTSEKPEGQRPVLDPTTDQPAAYLTTKTRRSR